MKMKRIREWKFREVLVEKGRKNGMKMMMNSEGFIGCLGKIVSWCYGPLYIAEPDFPSRTIAGVRTRGFCIRSAFG